MARQVIPPTPPNYDKARIVERPDGFYWQEKTTLKEYGPFETLLEAELDMQSGEDETAFEPGETLAEAEEEIGISDWLDPDSGVPSEEERTRIDDDH